MRKRWVSLVLILVTLMGLLPTKAEAVFAADRLKMREAVTEMIDSYAASVYQKDADDGAFRDFFVHGIYGNGKEVSFDESSAMVAALFNSCVMREALIEGITAGICTVQDQKCPVIYCKGGPQWHNFYYAYRYEAYEGEIYDEEKYLDLIVFSKDSYGDRYYTGPTNENDEEMELLVGGLSACFVVRREEVKKDTAVYHIELKISDVFNFDGDYQSIKDKGYDTSRDDKLNNLGFLLTFIGIDPFSWSFCKEFTIELPYECAHTAPQYHLVLDNETGTLTADTMNGYQLQEIEQLEKVDSEKGTVEPYYALGKQISLRHDANWVLEYEKIYGGAFMLTRENHAGDTGLYLFHSGALPQFIYDVPQPILNEAGEVIGRNPTQMYYSGVNHTEISIDREKVYRYRMENVVAADGSNMIYLSVTDCESGEVILEPSPMERGKKSVVGTPGDAFLGEHAALVSGRDFLFRFVGNKDYAKKQPYLTIYAYEDLDGQTPRSKIEVETLTSTCTEQGGTVYACRDCGYSYTTDVVPALGHSFGEYVYDNNASCTEDGTQTRACSVCNMKETITAPETALGHEYQSVVTAPTLTAEGYTTYTCTRCGDSYKADFVAKKEHTYVGVVTEPTCTEQGFTTYTCSECGDSYVDDYTDMIEHTPVIDPAVEPTCVEKGKTEGSHCGVCGFVIKKQANISTVNRHDFEEEITKIPTYDEDGEVTYTCKDCGKVETKTIPAFEKPTPKNPFTDVSEADWFYGPVIWALKEGVTGGKTETTFAPNEGCTRAQVVTFLWAANGKPEPESMDNPFTDVASDAWYLKPVLWAVEQGITGGVAEGKFGPEQTCTRAQIATFLWAANGRHAVSTSSSFVDVNDSDWFAAPVIWALEQNITSGIGDGKFGPNDTCTRAQVVTFLKKVYDK